MGIMGNCSPKWRLGSAIVCAVTALASWFLLPLPASAETSIERYHIDFGTQVELEPHCTDEAISWTGGYDVVITTTTTTSGKTLRSLNYVQDLTGLGLESGDAYRLNAHYHSLANEGGNGAAVYVFPQSYVQVSRNGAPNYVAHFVEIRVFSATGELVVEKIDGHPGSYIKCVGPN